MPNHWHFVLWPQEDGQLGAFVGWLTHANTQRRHAHYHTSGTGQVYQGRFKSFPVQLGRHLLTVVGYVQRKIGVCGLVRRGVGRGQCGYAGQGESAGATRIIS